MFISAQAKYTHLQKISAIFSHLKIYAIYKYKYYTVLSKYTSGFRKHKSNVDMANNLPG